MASFRMQSEICALVAQRSRVAAQAFLDEFLPSRRLSGERYELRRSADSFAVFADESSILDELERDVSADCALYYDAASRQSVPSAAFLFFTSDGAMIVGIAVPDESVQRWLEELASFTGARFACVTGDQRPDNSAVEFRTCCAVASPPKIVDGVLFSEG